MLEKIIFLGSCHWRNCFALIAVSTLLLLSGCNSTNVKSDSDSDSNSVPASVFRNSLQYSNSTQDYNSKVNHTIFKLDFIHYIVTQNRNQGPIDLITLRRMVKNWNSVATSPKEIIKFKDNHFYRFASLSRNNSDCSSIYPCRIDLTDVNILIKWMDFQVRKITHKPTNDGLIKSNVKILNPTNHNNLHKTLVMINSDPVGASLIQNAISYGTIIRVEELSGKHGYYNFTRNEIVIDPKILNYEFNMRYLIHELVHATNHTKNNSISEEVLSEIIGLSVQNRITNIPFEMNPYSMFVEHLLHANYGSLPVTNNIQQSLGQTGITLQ